MARRGKPATASESERRGIQSVEISAVILSALSDAGGAISLKQLSDIAGMPSSKIHRYLSSFVRTGLVRQYSSSGHYDLGPAALELGLAALARLDVVELAHQAMKDLSEETGVTSILSIWGQLGPTVVRWQRARTQLVTSLALGSVLPLLSSATGKVFLAYLPKAVTSDLVARELRANKRIKNKRNIAIRKSDIDDIIRSVRTAGSATVDSSVIPGLRALAAPILDHQGEASATITLIGTDDFLLNPNHSVAKSLAETCESLSFGNTDCTEPKAWIAGR